MADATANALVTKVGFNTKLMGLAAILPAAVINLASSREQQPLSPLEAQALS
jgi:hypothetical protein